MKIKIGTRGSKLALWQANFIAEQLKSKYPSLVVELVNVTTKGDKLLDAPLAKIGDKGLFIKELEENIIDGRIDLAVHSLKDVPAELPDDFIIAAITKRTEPLDAFVSNKYNKFDELPQYAKVGTSSLRRRAQLLSVRPDLQVENLRGNVETRLKNLDDENFDAIILAAAGLKRLGLENRITEILPTSLMLPAVGQGAIAVETLRSNENVRDIVAFLDNYDARVTSIAERAFLKVIGGSCQVPVGVFAKLENKKIVIEAIIASLDGKKVIRDTISGNFKKAEDLGTTLANKMLDTGGREILSEIIPGV